MCIVLDTMMHISHLREGWLTFITNSGMKPIIISHIADCLDSAIRKFDSVTASGHTRVTSLLCSVVIHSTVCIIHTKVVGVGFWLIALRVIWLWLKIGLNRRKVCWCRWRRWWR